MNTRVTGSFDWLPSGRCRLRVSIGRRADGTRNRLSRTIDATNDDDAQRQLDAWISTLTPSAVAARDRTVGELIDRWRVLWVEKVEESTMIDYNSICERHLRPGLGHIRVADLDVETIDLFSRSLDTGAPRRQKVHRLLRTILGQAVRWGWVDHNPAQAATAPRYDQPEIDPPDAQAVRDIIDAADQAWPGLSLMLWLDAVTGLRRGELCALRFGDIIDGQLVVSRSLAKGTNAANFVPGCDQYYEKPTKTNRVRRVALDTDTLAKINRHHVWLKERALSVGGRVVDNPRMFTDDLAGEIPWRPTNVTDRFARARQLAGHPTVRLHDLRHYSISQLLAAGVDPVTVSNRVGHRTTTMTLDRYGHMVPARDQAAADLLRDITLGESGS